MGNCLLKCNHKLFLFLIGQPITSGYTEKLISGIQKNRVKCFAIDTQEYLVLLKSSVIDMRWIYSTIF